VATRVAPPSRRPLVLRDGIGRWIDRAARRVPPADLALSNAVWIAFIPSRLKRSGPWWAHYGREASFLSRSSLRNATFAESRESERGRFAQTHAAVNRTGAGRWPDRERDPAGSGCLQRARGQRSGRRLMRAKRRTPISCRHRCPRKEPLHSHHRSGRVESRRSAPIFGAGRDNRGDSRPARKSRSRLYLAFSPR
jgi:hypothetical protein